MPDPLRPRSPSDPTIGATPQADAKPRRASTGGMAPTEENPGHVVKTDAPPVARPTNTAAAPALQTSAPVARASYRHFNMAKARTSGLIQSIVKFVRRHFQTKEQSDATIEGLKNLSTELKPPKEEGEYHTDEDSARTTLKDAEEGSYVKIGDRFGETTAVMAKLTGGKIVWVDLKSLSPSTESEAIAVLSNSQARAVMERLFNGDTTAALRKSLDNAQPREVTNAARKLLNLTDLAVKENKNAWATEPQKKQLFAGIAGLYLTSALSMMKELRTKDDEPLPNLSKLAQTALIQRLPPPKERQKMFSEIVTTFATEPHKVLKSPVSIHLLAALTVQHSPESKLTKKLLSNMGAWYDPFRQPQHNDLIVVANVLQNIATFAQDYDLKYTEEQKLLMEDTATALYNIQLHYEKANPRQRNERVLSFIGEGRLDSKRWSSQAKANAAALYKNSINLEEFRRLLQSQNLPSGDDDIAKHLKNVGLVGALTRIKFQGLMDEFT